MAKVSHFGMHKNHRGQSEAQVCRDTGGCDQARHFVTPLPGIGNGAHMLSHILRTTR